MRRLAALALVALALAPGTFVRTAIPDRHADILEIVEVTGLPDIPVGSDFAREGVWQLASPNIDFGGYSALVVLPDGELRAFSDRGVLLTMGAPGRGPVRRAVFGNAWDRGPLGASIPDIEAALRDPASGEYWIAFESDHSIIRYSPAGAFRAARQPPEWQGWSANKGAEAMALLPDGRFLVLPETARTGLLYPSDPTEEVAPHSFAFTLPDDFAPTDMAALPDGRVLVLLRKVEWAYPPFSAAIGIADPGVLEDKNAELQVELLVSLDELLPRENWEGLALHGVAGDGAVTLWLMSDDNLASFQRTLLARLVWHPDTDVDDGQEIARED